ncbi:MAG: chorismate synthase [Myxococcota bacterium]|nr:chorismate synthase [Myxococcota bacterium]
MSNTTGRLFRATTFGESHGEMMGVVIDGCPPGVVIDLPQVQADLDRRRPGQTHLTTPRDERDTLRVVSGLFDGSTTGSPLTIVFENQDTRSRDYQGTKDLFRPGHADYGYHMRYGVRDHRGGGRASARETISRVAAGAIGRQILQDRFDIDVIAWVSSVGSIEAAIDVMEISRADVDSHPTRCPDLRAAKEMEANIQAAKAAGDTLGGCVSAVAKGVPAGWGAPVFDKFEADLAKACLSLPACKGFEIGSGFAGTQMKGSDHNDEFTLDNGLVSSPTNHAGGVLGGITSGQPIQIKCAFKPVSTHFKQQRTVTKDLDPVEFKNVGRHDPCVLPRAVPLVEAALWLTLTDHYLITLSLGRS